MSSNQAVIAAIRGHHRQLSDELRVRTAAVLAAAARDEVLDAARDELHDWYRAELIPHAAAEEKTLYEAAAGLPATRLLIRGMLAEHQDLVDLITDLAAARQPLEIATRAASAQTLFASHLVKENDLLLPALDEAAVDLEAALAGMHELIGAPVENTGCNCGGCGDGAPDAVTPQVTTGDADVDPDLDLDVRAIPHGRRHDVIFGKLDALTPGESLTIVNDHDPKPLRYQASAIWPDRFEWTYHAAGPDVWRIEISDAR
jgi:uncharacterized protein (DUF2249 family)/hemerythrin-like domain-containing protein